MIDIVLVFFILHVISDGNVAKGCLVYNMLSEAAVHTLD